MKAIETLFGVMFATVKVVIISLVVILGLLFSIAIVGNVEDSKDDWRNYDIQFNIEDGLSTTYTVPVDEVLEDSINDTLEYIDSIVSNIG